MPTFSRVVSKASKLLSPFGAVLVAVLACTPSVGDACTTSQECAPVSGDLLCLTTEPGGYCTQFNCEPGQCEDSVCVAFRASESTNLACDNPQISSRFERTFCMAPCSGSSDCRTSEGYACVDMADPMNRRLYGAQIVDQESESSDTRVCVVPYEGVVLDPSDPENAEVCTGAAGSGGTGGAGGGAGTGGAGGGAGTGGAGGGAGTGGAGGGAGTGGAGGSAGSGGTGTGGTGTGGTGGSAGAGGASGSAGAGAGGSGGTTGT